MAASENAATQHGVRPTSGSGPGLALHPHTSPTLFTFGLDNPTSASPGKHATDRSHLNGGGTEEQRFGSANIGTSIGTQQAERRWCKGIACLTDSDDQWHHAGGRRRRKLLLRDQRRQGCGVADAQPEQRDTKEQPKVTIARCQVSGGPSSWRLPPRQLRSCLVAGAHNHRNLPELRCAV